MSDYNSEIDRALKYAAGRHGTPSWNPPPHPEADPDVVARRDSDPLWQYHRNLRDYSGDMPKGPTWPEGPSSYLAVHRRQVGGWDEAAVFTPPEGMVTHAESCVRWVDHQQGNNKDADLVLSTDGNGFGLTNLNEEDNPTHSNVRAHRELWDFHGRGRRPWFNAIHPLQDLDIYSAPHDSYGLLANSVKSGNRHALPPLVELLKKRDNPAGWYDGWTKLAKAMEDRIGDLPPEDVMRRGLAIGDATLRHSTEPGTHASLVKAARETGDFTPLLALSDHMEESGLPQYAQLLRLELANVLPHLRKTPKNKRSRL